MNIQSWKTTIPERLSVFHSVTVDFSKRPTTLREKCQNTEFFWAVFSCIQTEYGDLQSKYPYSVRRQENMDQKKLCIHLISYKHVL